MGCGMKILYAGPFSFPSSSANSLRVQGVVQALRCAGHEVTIASWDMNSADSSSSACICGMAEYESGLLSSFPKWLRGLFLGDCLVSWLNSRKNDFDLIILYGTHLGYLTRLLYYCKKNRVPLVLDVVEWFNLEDLPGGKFGPYAISHEVSMRYVAPKADGIFAISKRLENHFKSKGARVLRVLPLFDESDSKEITKFSYKDGLLHLCYVGTPGNKESLDLVIQALGIARSKGMKLKLHLAGFDKKELLNSLRGPIPKFLNDDSGCVSVYGRIPNNEAKELVRNCDFSLLLRPDRKANQFGFPSKMAESMMLGTPVIANLFSDLADHLVDSENSILVDSLSLDSLVSVFIKASKLTFDDKCMISQGARKTAISEFSTKSNALRIDGFVRQYSRV